MPWSITRILCQIPVKQIADTVYQLKDLKNLSKAGFEALDTIRLGNFLKTNRIPAEYSVQRLKEMVRNDEIKPTALYDYVFVDDGFQNKSVTGCEVYRSEDAGRTWKKTHDKPINLFFTYGYYFAKVYVSPLNSNKLFILGYNAKLSE